VVCQKEGGDRLMDHIKRSASKSEVKETPEVTTRKKQLAVLVSK
jgi:hypothetical protein